LNNGSWLITIFLVCWDFINIGQITFFPRPI
jgi:hypothetical protein